MEKKEFVLLKWFKLKWALVLEHQGMWVIVVIVEHQAMCCASIKTKTFKTVKHTLK
jgi:hypothetical protein